MSSLQTTDKDGYLGVTSENALRFSVADILKKVDHNVELIQQKRGKLLEEENRQRLEAISTKMHPCWYSVRPFVLTSLRPRVLAERSAEAGKEEREEEQKTHNSAQAE